MPNSLFAVSNKPNVRICFMIKNVISLGYGRVVSQHNKQFKTMGNWA